MNKIMEIKGGKSLLATYTEQDNKPREVFGPFLYEGELGVLFGDSNAGKSILANDIAFFASGGGHEWEGMESPNIPTLYIDMEMTDKQFASRYYNAGDYITDNYFRGTVDVLASKEGDVWQTVKANIVYYQRLPNAPKFIIIDNITNGFGSIYSPSAMKDLIFDMKQMKERWGLTMLLIAHCPKRKRKTEITADSLGGSKMILNFADSAFAVAPSLADDSLRYIKQIKTRESQKMPNVITVKITNEPYLCMEYKNMCREEEHLKTRSDEFWFLEITPEIEPILMGKLLEDNGILRTKDLVELGISYEAVRGYARMYNIDVCFCY